MLLIVIDELLRKCSWPAAEGECKEKETGNDCLNNLLRRIGADRHRAAVLANCNGPILFTSSGTSKSSSEILFCGLICDYCYRLARNPLKTQQNGVGTTLQNGS